MPWVKLWRHAFQSKITNQWYIENSRCSLTVDGQPDRDPVMDLNRELWASGNETLQNQARVQKKKATHISNIYVVKDPGAPANEGKVFLFKYGVQIFGKIQACLNPEFED